MSFLRAIPICHAKVTPVRCFLRRGSVCFSYLRFTQLYHYTLSQAQRLVKGEVFIDFSWVKLCVNEWVSLLNAKLLRGVSPLNKCMLFSWRWVLELKVSLLVGSESVNEEWVPQLKVSFLMGDESLSWGLVITSLPNFCWLARVLARNVKHQSLIWAHLIFFNLSNDGLFSRR